MKPHGKSLTNCKRLPILQYFPTIKSPFLMGKSTISIAIFNSFLYVYRGVNLHFPMVFLWFSYGFPMFSYGFPMVFLWFSYSFPMFSYGFPMLIPPKNPRINQALDWRQDVVPWASELLRDDAVLGVSSPGVNGILAAAGWTKSLKKRELIDGICWWYILMVYDGIYIYIHIL